MRRILLLLLLSLPTGRLLAEAQPGTDAPRTGAPKSTPSPAFDVQKFLGEIPARRSARLAGVPGTPPLPATTFPVNNAIDVFITARWPKEAQAAVCDDATFVRRAHLDIIGVAPSVEEARAFVNSTAADKRARLVESLLSRSEDYAAHWLPFWEEALAGTPAGGNGLAARNVFSAWLFDSFKRNTPFDRMVAELLLGDFDTSTSAKKPKEEFGENDPRAKVQRDTVPSKGGALPRGYIRNKTHADTMQTAANVGQVFLGTAIKCATCHNHFDNPEWKLETVTAFASFFAPKDVELVRCENRKNAFIAPKFLFANAGEPVPSEFSGRVASATQALIDPRNPRFARAFVNRLWKRYVGLGLMEPVDDFRADRTPSHPELLDWLADDFLRHGCDPKHTTALILNSRTYQLAFNAALCDRFDSAKPDAPRFFRSPALRRLHAEQVIDSARMAGQQKLETAQRVYRLKDSTALTRALARPPYVSAVSTSRPADVAILQMLEIMNGPEFNALAYKAEALKSLAKLENDGARVDWLFWAALSRAPCEAERNAALAFVKSGGEAWGDLFWALLSSPEFHYLR